MERFEKDRLIAQLKQFIKNDSAWLTPEDQWTIENRIDELDKFIQERYDKHRQ